jgi:hypothetical protein
LWSAFTATNLGDGCPWSRLLLLATPAAPKRSGVGDGAVDGRGVPQQFTVAHRSVRSCQKSPSRLRSYSSLLTQASNVLPSLSRMTCRQHSGTEHTSDTGTVTGAVTMALA